MRYVTFQLIPKVGELHPFGTLLRDDPDINRRAIHHFNVLDDSHTVILVEFDAPADELRDLVADHPDVISSNVSESDGSTFVYAHFRPDEWAEQLYSVPRTNEIFLDMPMYYTDRGALEITAIGEFEDIRESMVDLPKGVGLNLLSTGEYSPESGGLYEQLTPKQQVTLRAAVETGYYEEPRNVTYQDIAEELGLAAGTVGEHLRKIESKILTNVLPAAGEAPVPR